MATTIGADGADVIWRSSGLDNLPDVRPEGDLSRSDFPLAVDAMPLTELANNMQYAAGMCAWASTLLSGVDAQVSYLKDAVEEGRYRATKRYREQHGEQIATLKLSAEEVRAAAADADPALKESREELRQAVARQKRFERLLQAWQTVRDTYSRQIAIRDLERERR